MNVHSKKNPPMSPKSELPGKGDMDRSPSIMDDFDEELFLGLEEVGKELDRYKEESSKSHESEGGSHPSVVHREPDLIYLDCLPHPPQDTSVCTAEPRLAEVVPVSARELCEEESECQMMALTSLKTSLVDKLKAMVTHKKNLASQKDSHLDCFDGDKHKLSEDLQDNLCQYKEVDDQIQSLNAQITQTKRQIIALKSKDLASQIETQKKIVAQKSKHRMSEIESKSNVAQKSQNLASQIQNESQGISELKRSSVNGSSPVPEKPVQSPKVPQISAEVSDNNTSTLIGDTVKALTEGEQGTQTKRKIATLKSKNLASEMTSKSNGCSPVPEKPVQSPKGPQISPVNTNKVGDDNNSSFIGDTLKALTEGEQVMRVASKRRRSKGGPGKKRERESALNGKPSDVNPSTGVAMVPQVSLKTVTEAEQGVNAATDKKATQNSNPSAVKHSTDVAIVPRNAPENVIKAAEVTKTKGSARMKPTLKGKPSDVEPSTEAAMFPKAPLSHPEPHKSSLKTVTEAEQGVNVATDKKDTLNGNPSDVKPSTDVVLVPPVFFKAPNPHPQPCNTPENVTKAGVTETKKSERKKDTLNGNPSHVKPSTDVVLVPPVFFKAPNPHPQPCKTLENVTKAGAEVAETKRKRKKATLNGNPSHVKPSTDLVLFPSVFSEAPQSHPQPCNTPESVIKPAGVTEAKISECEVVDRVASTLAMYPSSKNLNTLWCQTCNLFFTSIVGYVSHLELPEHLDREEKAGEERLHKLLGRPKTPPAEQGKAQEALDYTVGVEFLKVTRLLYCGLCKCPLATRAEAATHCQSPGHTNKYKEYILHNTSKELAFQRAKMLAFTDYYKKRKASCQGKKQKQEGKDEDHLRKVIAKVIENRSRVEGGDRQTELLPQPPSDGEKAQGRIQPPIDIAVWPHHENNTFDLQGKAKEGRKVTRESPLMPQNIIVSVTNTDKSVVVVGEGGVKRPSDTPAISSPKRKMVK
ncbi:Zinc finger matrin-type protein CG9776 [Chionoecetes opilio]|uniref:Zinc finger matrin-type protein CG9776 n=1 Tax=Chionoecetes opilio TaxID=41210 RepID=A0A8J4Y922_CHIOP|nr:Zinc finger matrin-type protein CG9776 [Chionoecetes opilio]